jgi:subtilisin family serine protease
VRAPRTGLALVVVAALTLPAAAVSAAPGNNGNGNGKGSPSSSNPSQTTPSPGNPSSNAAPAAPENDSARPADKTPGKPADTGNGSDKTPGKPADTGNGSDKTPGKPADTGNGSAGTPAADPVKDIGRPTEAGKPASSAANTSPGNSAAGSSSASVSGSASGQSAAATNSKAALAARATATRAAFAPGRSSESRALTRTTASTPAGQANEAAIADCLQAEFTAAGKVKGGGATSRIRTLTAAQIADLEQVCEEETGDLGDYIVQFVPGSNASDVAKSAREKSALKESNRFSVKRTYTNVFPGMLISANPRQITALRKNPNVTLIEPDGMAMAVETQTPAPWGLDRVDQSNLPLNGSFTYGATAAGVTTYIVDTGVRSDHVDFTGRVAGGFSAIADGRGTSDCNGHGTHVAGTVAGATYGVAKSAAIVPVRVLDCYGSGSWSGVIAGLDWIAGSHAAGTPAVANMSLGGGANTSVDDAVRAVINDGVTVVVAAGNSAADACTFSPARTPAAVTVAATDSSDNQASFSNFGPCVDIYAPGVSIPSAWYTSSTATASLSGTSMAAPHVAGAAALVLAANPSASPADVGNALTSAATADVVRGVTAGTVNRLLFTGGTPVTPTPEEPVTPEEPTATVPDAPSGVSAAGGSKSATVVWAVPADGGSPLTGQTVWVFDSRGKRVGSVSVASDATSVTVTGLAPRKKFSFSVSAWNVVGTGAESARSNTITTTR